MTASNSPANSDWITHVSHRAMATDFVVMLPQKHATAVEKVVLTLEMLDDIERQLTIYRPESEVSHINRLAASKPVQVSESTFAILERAIQWSHRTAGRFDITAGPLVELWGFTKRKGQKPSPSEVKTTLAAVGYQKLILNAQQRSIAFSVPGMSINLGGIGKGYAIDRLAERLRGAGITDFLIHGGQSSVYAAGNESAATDRGWTVALSHPTRSGRRLAGIWLKDAALGTSGSGKQFFHHRGKRFGHVIDPRVGYPTTDLLSLSIRQTEAIDADAAGTGYFLFGSQDMRNTESVPMISVRPGSRQEDVVVETFGEWDWVDAPNDANR